MMIVGALMMRTSQQITKKMALTIVIMKKISTMMIIRSPKRLKYSKVKLFKLKDW